MYISDNWNPTESKNEVGKEIQSNLDKRGKICNILAGFPKIKISPRKINIFYPGFFLFSRSTSDTFISGVFSVFWYFFGTPMMVLLKPDDDFWWKTSTF